MILLACKKKEFTINVFVHTKHFQVEFSRQGIQLSHIPMQLFLSVCVTAKGEVQKHTDMYFSKMLADFYNQEWVELSSIKTSRNL